MISSRLCGFNSFMKFFIPALELEHTDRFRCADHTEHFRIVVIDVKQINFLIAVTLCELCRILNDGQGPKS